MHNVHQGADVHPAARRILSLTLLLLPVLHEMRLYLLSLMVGTEELVGRQVEVLRAIRVGGKQFIIHRCGIVVRFRQARYFLVLFQSQIHHLGAQRILSLEVVARHGYAVAALGRLHRTTAAFARIVLILLLRNRLLQTH